MTIRTAHRRRLGHARARGGPPAGPGWREIPHTHGLLGHSDADALCHAITDALFGAAALGDIGHHFPDTDAQFQGADSLALLAEAARRVAGRLQIGNVDATDRRAGAEDWRRTSRRCASASPARSASRSIRST